MEKISIKILIFSFLTLFIMACPVAAFADVTPSPAQVAPVFDYTGNPGYAAYYNFAKYHLFDGQDFFTSNSTAINASCPTTPTDPEGQLKAWGFIVDGPEKTSSMVMETYTSVCILYQFPKFKDVLGAEDNQIEITFRAPTDFPKNNNKCPWGGFTDNTTHIEMCGFLESPTELYFHRFVLIHEFAHVLSGKPAGDQAFQAFQGYGRDALDGLKKKGNASLNCPGGGDDPAPYADCFADMVATFPMGNQTFFADAYRSVWNFDSDTDLTQQYRLIKDSIFGGSVAPPTSAPDTSTCNGMYALTNPQHINFGDPSCIFSKTDLLTQLQQLDPNNAAKWFNVIIPCESGFDANAWRDPNETPHTPDPDGAWGLFQMGDQVSSQSISHGPYDNGKINWPVQVSNAVSYNDKIGDTFSYWGCNK